MKMTLPLSLGALVALSLAYLHLVPAPQGECSTSSAQSTGAMTACTDQNNLDAKLSCCSDGACCKEGGACCVAGVASSEPAKCCSAGDVCPAGTACCAASGCDCQSLVSMPRACDPSVREALLIAGDLARFVDQEISTMLPSVNAEGDILQMNFLEITDGLGTLPKALVPCDGVVPQKREP